jgi:hypothetical protein
MRTPRETALLWGYGPPNEKARSRDRAFFFCQFDEAAQAAFDTSVSLSISSVPIRR